MKTIETTTDIDAPPELVWQIITDFDRYREWNPFITALDGELHKGARLRATFTLPGRKPQTFQPNITIFEPGKRLVWRGRLAIPKLFDAEHILVVQPHGDGTTFVHREHFRGALVPFVAKTLAATHHAFNEMDTALAHRAAMQTSDREAPSRRSTS